MSYAAFDDTIQTWADENKLKVSVEAHVGERRFCYIPGGPQECFQISIGPCLGEHLSVDACDIETMDGAELHASWRAAASDLRTVLDRALEQVMLWSNRPKGPAMWQPQST